MCFFWLLHACILIGFPVLGFSWLFRFVDRFALLFVDVYTCHQEPRKGEQAKHAPNQAARRFNND